MRDFSHTKIDFIYFLYLFVYEVIFFKICRKLRGKLSYIRRVNLFIKSHFIFRVTNNSLKIKKN